jgi:Cdc6-like AAA superfamily ATPase
VNLNLSTPLQLIGRSVEFQRIIEILAKDGDLLITGVPGSGRRTLVRGAAQEVNTVILEIDCIRATEAERFVQLLAEAISQNWEAEKVQTWLNENSSAFFTFNSESQLKLIRSLEQEQLWQAFASLLDLLEIMDSSPCTQLADVNARPIDIHGSSARTSAYKY